MQQPSYTIVTDSLRDITPILKGINPDGEHGQTVDKAMTTWYKLARDEFTDLIGEDAKFRDAKFKWTPAVKTTARPWIHQVINPWIHESMNPWIHGSIDPWIHGSMDP